MPNIILVRNDYPDEGALRRVLNYVLRSSLQGGYAVDPNFAYIQMQLVKKAFYKTGGVQLKHFFITFSNDEMGTLDFNDLLELGFQTGQLFGEFQMVYGIHLDTDHVHIHFVMNTVSFLDGHKYRDGLTLFVTLCNQLRARFPKSQTNLFFTEHYNHSNPYTPEKAGQFSQLY